MADQLGGRRNRTGDSRNGEGRRSGRDNSGRQRPGYEPGYHETDYYEAGRYEPSDYESGQYEPGRYGPSDYEPGRYEPGQYEPGRYRQSDYEPGRYEPRQYEPARYEPSDYEPGQYEPSGYDAPFDGRRHPVPARSPRPPRREAALGRRPAPWIRAPRGPQDPPRRGGNISLAVAGTAALVLAVNVLLLTGFRLPALGFWFILILPAYLLYTTDTWRGSSGAERVGYSVAAVILLLMVGGLMINTILPPLGIARPLDTGPVVIFADVLNASLYAFRWRRGADLSWLSQVRGLRPSEVRLIGTGLLCVVLAVLGADRLNNNAGDQVTLVALACVIVTVIVLLARHRQLGDGVISVTLYLVSLAILLMESLRGWYISGDDIQTEYRIFQLTEAHGHWSMSAAPHLAYNACLSITILPTEIANVVNVDGPYVFKLFFQLLFALCPVLAYTFWRRYASKLVALVAMLYFIGFPTYVNDIPGANRQEIAFLFVSAAALAVTNSNWPQAWRRVALFAAAIGVELSHYSTMYVFVGTLAVGWALGSIVRLRRRRASSRAGDSEETAWTTARQTIGAGSVLAAISVLLLWGGLATQTAGPLLTDVKAAVTQFSHPSAVTPYSLFSRSTVSPQQVLTNYRAAALSQNAAATPHHVYFPTSVVDRYSTPLESEPAMPLTPLGRVLSRIGVPVSTVNTDVRQGAAKDEQLFIVAGFAAFIFSRRLRRRVSHEVLWLAAASIVTVAVFTVFPNFSVDYSAERALQEALIWAAPVLVAGSIALFWPFGRRSSVRIAAVVSAAIFISTIGFLPQILGGYAPQLNLNNSGVDYDFQYMQQQQVAAVTWLETEPEVLPGGLQAPMGPTTADPFEFSNPGSVTGTQFVDDIYPVLIKRYSWVILSYATLHTGRAPLYSDGQLVTYRYPVAFLEDNKNLVYNNGSAEIYK